eukprot:TRINITY_DN74960_c0_g1_i1.p2 TRINITY_DN74960_c0_g1~~TRINITY_DN74960_c0_g1_i1.p2  ORF type:complete len:638 (+),score=340.71 TRINITY_DN74960_c0_g1_i1:291-2204(+)
MHIAQGIFKTINVNKCTKAGGTFVFWVADWFALMNDKMGGCIDRIHTVGEYLIEVWKAAGMDLTNVEFVWSSDAINKKASEYWVQMLDIARYFTVNRMMRCCQIMGRAEGKLTCAQILYPFMQCTDIFFLKADICQLGLDQKKVNMLAREYCNSSGRKGFKPIILSHHMMFGLLENQEKMSKSDPNSAIFMEDSEEDVKQKLNGAWFPIDDKIAKNPVLDLIDSIVYTEATSVFTAGGKAFKTRADLEEGLKSSAVSAQEVRDAAAEFVNAKLAPVRKHFQEDDRARGILSLVKKYKEEMAKEEGPKRAVREPLDDNAVLIPLLPTQEATLNQTITAAHTAKQFAAQGKKVRVMILDWTAYLLNLLDGDMKNILRTAEFQKAYINAFAAGVEGIEITVQSEVILEDPGKYWVGVINAGRSVSLNDMGSDMGKDYQNKSEGESANEVIAGLMFQQDVYSAKTQHVVSPHSQFAKVIARTGATVHNAEELVPCSRENFLTVEPSVNGKFPEMAVPQVVLLGDDDTKIGSRIKSAFCAPGEVEGNPVLVIAGGLLSFTGKPLSISKKGADAKAYSDIAELRAAFASGDVHPGDLKPAVQAALKAVVGEARASLEKSDDFKKLATQIRDLAKKLNKPAKKK